MKVLVSGFNAVVCIRFSSRLLRKGKEFISKSICCIEEFKSIGPKQIGGFTTPLGL